MSKYSNYHWIPNSLTMYKNVAVLNLKFLAPTLFINS